MEKSDLRNRFLLITVVTGLLVWSFFAADIRLGQDLKGGTTLRFSVDIDSARKRGVVDPAETDEDVVAKTLEIIDERINRYGLAETNITPVGENKFEISLPAGAQGDVDEVIDVVTTLGDLQFRIEVLPSYSDDPEYLAVRTRHRVWPGTATEFDAFKQEQFERWKDARDRNMLPYDSGHERFYIVKKARRVTRDDRDGQNIGVNAPDLGVDDFVVLEKPQQERYDFNGRILTNVRATKDVQPVVLFSIKTNFQNVFGEWTGANAGLPMAIVLNNEYRSAPYIKQSLSTDVQVDLGGGSFQDMEREAQQLATTLQTGSLLVKPRLEAKDVVGASLAGDSRDRGILAVIVAFALVLVFMVLYYRSSGVVANIALLLNLVLLVGFLAFFQAVLTLPGIAGIVLTVGMAVDANILINERIREELRSGRSLRRAIAEGYDRALSAIVDANVTSLITALFLYVVGTGPVKGFAITLAIGLVVSMFTSIFVTRTFLEWMLKRGWITDLTMWGSGEPPSVSWLGMRKILAPISVVLMVFGLVAFSAADQYTLYDVDFTGGYKLQATFRDPVTPDQVKNTLATTQESVEIEVLERTEREDLVTRRISVPAGPYPNVEVLAVGGEGTTVEVKVQRLFQDTARDLSEPDQAAAFEAYVREVFQDELLPGWLVAPPTRVEAAEDLPEPIAPFDGGLHLAIAFYDPGDVLEAGQLEAVLEKRFPLWSEAEGERQMRTDLGSVPGFERQVRVAERPIGNERLSAFDVWWKSTSDGDPMPSESDPERLQRNLGDYLSDSLFTTHLREAVGEEVDLDALRLSEPFPSQNQIGQSVAQRLKDKAIAALFFSLVGIIVYIALRFRSAAMGFAAVLCLFHDVAITLGIIAVANMTGLVDARINLAMVAAFLTLVGYSVNDTVVIFDRIRENRGKRPRVTADIIDLSVNQTFARTIKTSATFLLVCVALFGFNIGQRNVLEGFAFLLILGAFVGTYSTIAISSPLLLYLPWFWHRAREYRPANAIVTTPASRAWLLPLVPVMALVWLAWGIVFAAGAFLVGLLLFVPWAMRDDAIEPQRAASA